MRLVPSSLGVVVSLLVTAAAQAQAPTGPAFQVNTYTTGRQGYPHVALRHQGDFVVVWDHRPQYGVTPSDVHARRYSAGGTPMGGEFRVNAFTTSAQTVVGGGGVALDRRGNAVVTWTEFRSGIDVFARRVSAAGQPLGDDFQINPVTAGFQFSPAEAVAPDGRFVVVWEESYEIMGRRFDAFGTPQGGAFLVNTYTTNRQDVPDVAIDAAGNFTVVWQSYAQNEPISANVHGQRFDAAGARLGGEFLVNTVTTDRQGIASIAMNGDGDFVVAWEGTGPLNGSQVWARRYARTGAPLGIEFAMSNVPPGGAAQQVDVAMDGAGNFMAVWDNFIAGPTPFPGVRFRRFAASGAPRGAEFIAVMTANAFPEPRIASDGVGNFVVTWQDAGVDDREVFAQRFGGLFAAGMTFNDDASGNDVLEVNEDFSLFPSWRNLTGAAQTFQSAVSDPSVPKGLFLSLSLGANYGTVANGAVGTCTTCIGGGLVGSRPTGHVDVTFLETIQPDTQGQAQRWAVHVGESFTDVPRSNGFYRYVETLLHRGVTAGCGAAAYCPSGVTTREQMAVFLLAAKEGADYAPQACGTPLFADVPPSSPFCRWIEELARRGVTGGCGGDNFCPGESVSREQMAVFVLRTLDPALNPPACVVPLFADVPPSSPFCRWIEELARRGVVSGCGGGNYCPAAPVTREQMAVFLSLSFGLTLYGP